MSKDKQTKEKVSFGQKVKGLALKGKAMWKTPLEGRYLTLKEMGCFGLFALGNSFILSAINYVATVAFIPYFYKIDTIHAYIILALAQFINMLCLPFIGNKIEKTQTKWGKYKPFILFCIPIYAVFTIMAMWIPQFSEETSRIIYAYLACVPVLVLSTFCNNMYQNMPTVITPNNQERADIMTPIGLIVGFAPSVLQIVAGPIRAVFKEQGKEFVGMRIIGLVSLVLGIICMLFILKVKERVYNLDTGANKEDKVTFFQAMKMLSKNKPLIIFCIALILGSLRDFTGQFRWLIIQFRFHENVKTAINISGLPQTIIGFAATVSMLLLPIVTRKMNKRSIVILFTAISLIPNLILSIVGYQNIPVGTVSLVVLTILFFISCVNPMYLLIPIMLGELADWQQYKTGKRLDGHLQNLLFVVPTLAMNIGMIFSYFLQKQVGFEAKDYEGLDVLSQAQQEVCCNWFNIVAIISAVSGALMLIVMLFYPLSKKKHQMAVDALKANSVISNVDEEVVIDSEQAVNENVGLNAQDSLEENVNIAVEAFDENLNPAITEIDVSKPNAVIETVDVIIAKAEQLDDLEQKQEENK